MGYRSNVAVVITAENKFKKYLEELKTNEVMRPLIEEADFADNGEDGIRLSWSSIKWYNYLGTYPEIIAFEEWLDKITEDEGTSYHFVRVGEELDDIEEKIEGDPKYWIYIERQLSPEF